MAWKETAGAITITGKEDTMLFAMITLQVQLQTEIKGLKFRQSAYAAIKRRWNLKGSRQRVLEQFEKIVEDTKLESRKRNNAEAAATN